MTTATAPHGAHVPQRSGSHGRRAAVLGLSLALVWAATIAGRIWQVPGAEAVQMGAFALFAVLALPTLPRVPLTMLALCAAVGLATVALKDNAAALLARATGDAAYLAAFFAAMAVLRDAAATSVAVHRCGEMLVSRSPGKRYAALSIGGSLLSIIINSGALNLLGTMVVATNTLRSAGGDPQVRAIRERRMMLALLRSFCAGILLSPLSLGFAVILSCFPQVGWLPLLASAVACGILLLLLGALTDRLTYGGPRLSAADRLSEWAAALPLVAIVLAIVSLVLATEVVLGTSLLVAVMVAVPLCGLAWMLAQTQAIGVAPATRLARTLRRAGDFVVRDLSGARVEVVVISTAGFIGALLASLLPLAELRTLVASSGTSPTLILVAAFFAVIALGQMGANPILSVTVLGAIFPDPLSVGIHPLVMAMTLFTAWATTTGSSSAIAAVLILSRICGAPPSTIGRSWNGPFTLVSGAVFLALMLAIHTVVAHAGLQPAASLAIEAAAPPR